MRKTPVLVVIAILLIFSFPTIVFANPPDNPPVVSGFSQEQILVKFQPNVSLPEAAQIHRQVGGQVKETIPGIGVQMVAVPKGQMVAKANAYSSNARVAYAEPDFVAEAVDSPDDVYFDLQWGLTKIEAPQAWDVTTGSPSINIAILDTGIDMDHPDLVDKIISSIDFTHSASSDDVYGHGTHVAGIAAAMTDNNIGVAGLGYTATIMNVKVLSDAGAGAYSWIASGIIWATNNGADIINMSLGGPSDSSTLEDAINYAWSKGVVVVAAAGNSGAASPFYPAYYTNCIAVAATDVNDAKASWSNYGDWVDVAAPGVSIYSTLKDGNYGYMSGTSMASPHVAGLASLVFTTVSDVNSDGKINDEVRDQMEATCDDIGVSGIGYGRINAAQAVDSVPVTPGAITGQVTDAENGLTIFGAEVTDGIRTAITDTAGMYAIEDVPPGTYQVVAVKEGYQTSSLTVNVVSGTTTEANFSLSQTMVPGSITGSVTDGENGSPIVGATVTDGTRMATTDTLGEYTIANVPPGSYELTASKDGYESSSLMVTVLEGNTSVADLSLVRIVVPGSITGSVTYAVDGSPVVGATVGDGTRVTTTDASGEYTISDVPEGSYDVTASKEDFESLTSSVTVLSGSTSVLDFSLNQKAPVTNTMWVNSIGFVEKGKNLFIEVNVVSAGGALSGVGVGLSLECGNGEIWNFSGTTNNVGSVKFKLGKAPVGNYLTTVNNLVCGGFVWDTSKGISSAGYALGS